MWSIEWVSYYVMNKSYLWGLLHAIAADAFDACEFVMDYLKQDAPFWKAEFTEQGKHWVQVKASDQQADKRW